MLSCTSAMILQRRVKPITYAFRRSARVYNFKRYGKHHDVPARARCGDKRSDSSGDRRLQLKRHLLSFYLSSSLRLRATATASDGYRWLTIKSQSNYASLNDGASSPMNYLPRYKAFD